MIFREKFPLQAEMSELETVFRSLWKEHPDLELALYSGRQEVEEEIYEAFDFVKVGPYVEALGPLSEASTNQRMYYHREDITSRFWHKHR